MNHCTTRVCLDCSADISGRHGNAKQCEPCSIAKSCWIQSHRDRPGRDTRPYVAAPPMQRECIICDRSFETKNSLKVTCSVACRMWNRAHPGVKRPFEITCWTCGRPITFRVRRSAKWCNGRCRALNERARDLGLPSEFINHQLIFERDRWTCHICGKPVDSFRPRGDFDGASLDHIIPLSIPGSPGHVWENVALTHRQCNVGKCNRVRSEDWALYHLLASMREVEEVTTS